MPDALYKWTMRPGSAHCKSCIAADGQVHPYSAWQAANILPRSSGLICGLLCNCTVEITDLPEQGDLQTVINARIHGAGHAGQPASPAAATAGSEGVKPMANDDIDLEQHATFAAEASVNAAGEFEILAITKGVGNGWTFTETALRASLALWEGINTFIDHGSMWAGRSIRDLAGVGRGPAWDESAGGVKLTLKPFGPSGPLLAALGREMLAEGDKPKVGFSADVIFTAKDKTVQSILRVLSLDLVFDPARGGAFLRALNQAGYRREAQMADEGNKPAGVHSAGDAAAQIAADQAAVQTLLGAQQQATALAAEVEKSRNVRVQMSAYLLDAGLAASRLPAPAQKAIRAQFAGKAFEPADLTAAIEAQRELVAELTAGAVVQGPGRVSAMFSTNEKLQAAVDDLLQAPRDEESKTLKVQRLTGIRELYHMLTGDLDYHGGYHPEHIHLATTSDFSGLVKNALNKIVAERWSQLGRAGYTWWEKIVVVEHFNSLNSITGTLVGSVGTLPSVAEGAEYTELVVGDSPETASFTKYGGYIPLTLELIDRDDARKLAAYPRELANAALRRLSGLVAAVFTDNSAVGPTMADTGALFNSTALATAGGHLNLLTTALSVAQWEVVKTAVYVQPMLVKNSTAYLGTGAKMAVDPRFLLVPRALQLTGRQIIYPTLEHTSQIYSENQQRGEPGDVITVPEWTDTTDWAAVVDPAIAPAIYVGERFGLLPEIFVAGDNLSPAVFSNDESRIKVRHFNAVWVNDFRPLHKSNV